MEKMQIKLKECCLTCEHFSPDWSAIGICASERRDISCIHMCVCGKYAEDSALLDVETKKLNLNSNVKVKLTPHGVDVYYHRFDNLNESIKAHGRKLLEPDMPKIDKDGFTSMQLWQFVEIYGEHIGMAKENVIEPLYIYVDENDIEDAKA